MQAAAPTALLTSDAKAGKTGKATGKHSAQAGVKSAFHAILGAKAAAQKADPKDASAVKAALLKSLEKTAAARKHADGLRASLIKHGQSLAQTHAGQLLLDQKAALAKAILKIDSDSNDDGKKLKKKAAGTPHHADGLEAGVSSMMAVNPGIKGPGRSDQGRTVALAPAAADHEASTTHAAARKGPEIRVHVVDARKKHVEATSEDLAASMKPAKLSPADRDPSTAAVIARGSDAHDVTTREIRGPGSSPATPSPGTLQHLREMAGSELTRAAGIILRDGGGEIKLTLKPESLGSVRIRMNLVDNAIEGRIIVDNAAVKHVFEGSLDSLMRALTAEGFQTASLQVSVGGQGADNGRSDREPLPRMRRVNAAGSATGFDWNVPGVESVSLGDLLVNMFV